MSNRFGICTPLYYLLVFCLPLSLFAQTSGYSESPGKAPTFKYHIWGQVRNPGMHILGPQIDITELLSAAGGPTKESNLSDVEIIYGIDKRVAEINLDELFESGETLTLSPGDVVIVKRKTWPKIRETIGIVSSIAVFINLAYTMARYYQ